MSKYTKDQIEALLAAATPGEYEFDGIRYVWRKPMGEAVMLAEMRGTGAGLSDAQQEANGRLFAAAPTVIRQLLDRLTELEKECKEVGELFDEQRAMSNGAYERGLVQCVQRSEDTEKANIDLRRRMARALWEARRRAQKEVRRYHEKQHVLLRPSDFETRFLDEERSELRARRGKK